MDQHELTEFLKERGIDVRKFEEEKIDCNVISLMTDEQLKEFIPAYGDRVAVFTFCRTKCQPTGTSNCAQSLQELRTKWKRNRGFKSGNKFAKKESRRVELGWMDYDANCYKQVRQKKGGGVRHLSVDKTLAVQDLMLHASETFFPNGVSGKGNIDEFDISIKDFKGGNISPQSTVSDLYEQSKLRILRVYLYTKRKVISSESMETADNNNDSLDLETTDHHSPVNSFQQDSDMHPQVTASSTEEATASSSVQDIYTREDSSDEFEATDTPPITFRRSRALQERLRLRRRAITTEEERSATSAEASTEVSTEVNRNVTTEVERAPQTASIEEHVAENSSYDGPQNFTLKDILSWWTAKTILAQDKDTFVVQRGKVFKSIIRTIKRDSFNYCRSFTVHFSGEDGEDFGGPKREFLRLLMNEVQEECFQGHEGEKFFRHDLEKIANKTYETVGSLVAFSILHGGPGLPVLHPVVYTLITNGNCENETLPTIDECLVDYDQHAQFQAIQQASDEPAYAAALADISDWAADQGLSLYNRHIEGKDALMRLLIQNEISYRVRSEIDQFQTGLNKVGLFLEAMSMAPSEFKSLFTKCEKKLSFSQLRTMYKVQYSPQGSNNRTQENNAIYCLEAFLADCEGGASGITLEEVMSFWTGASSLPPLGFEKNLEVTFGVEKRLPSAHTCSLVLNIWRGYADPDMFASDMEKAITWGGGFHLA